MKNENLVDQQHWDATYENLSLYKPSRFDSISRLIRKHIKDGKGLRAFEIGCFPGRYLTVFGDLGYSVGGIDLTPRVKELSAWFKNDGYTVDEFFCEDFLTFKNESMYDLVCSFGFIEHFVNFEDVIKKHAKLVAPEGKLVITTPNFKGVIQNRLHVALDKKNFDNHFIPSMDPYIWRKVLEECGFKVLYCGWWGGFDFWSDNQGSFFARILGMTLNKAGKLLRFIPLNNQAYSPYSVIVAEKNI